MSRGIGSVNRRVGSPNAISLPARRRHERVDPTHDSTTLTLAHPTTCARRGRADPSSGLQVTWTHVDNKVVVDTILWNRPIWRKMSKERQFE